MTTTIESALIGYYKRKSSTECVEISIQEFLDKVSLGYWKKHVDFVRQADPNQERVADPQRNNQKLNEYDRRKEVSPCVTISGVFDGEKVKGNLRVPSRLMAIDLDHLDERVDEMQKLLAADPFVYAVFKSIGGKGLCLLFFINPDRWDDSFDGIADYLIEKYGLVNKQFDKSSRNINRLRYISYDQDMPLCNPKVRLFSKYPTKAKKAVKVGQYIDTEDDIEFVIRQVEERGLEFHDTDGEWVRAGLALASKYGSEGRDYFQRISQFRHDYDPDHTDKVYEYLCKNRRNEVSISTFYYLCKQAGLQIMTPVTKEVVSKAAASKRNKVPLAACLDTVVRLTDVAEEVARPIIEQVYASSETFETDESLFDQLEQFLSVNYDLRYNEITHYIEDGKTILLDRNLNDIYIAAAKAFDNKVTKDNVFTILQSSVVRGYHPLKAFFAAYRERKPDGTINAVCDSIRHNMPGNFVQFFMRKFLVGLVGSVYGKQCPLMPILCGAPNSGKTQFWRRFLPKEIMDYYGECKFKKPGDDELLMCKKILLLNDDFEVVFLEQHARFKSLTDANTFSVRKPYGKAHEDLKRLAMICGTSNETTLLSDPTGNRRIVPIHVNSFDYDAYNAVDKIDLLMEAYHLYMDGETGDLTNEQINFLAKHTTKFVDYSTERDLIESYFNVPSKAGDGELMNQGEILAYLQQMSGIKNLKSKTISQEMKALKFPYMDGVYYAPYSKSVRGFWIYKNSGLQQQQPTNF